MHQFAAAFARTRVDHGVSLAGFIAEADLALAGQLFLGNFVDILVELEVRSFLESAVALLVVDLDHQVLDSPQLDEVTGFYLGQQVQRGKP